MGPGYSGGVMEATDDWVGAKGALLLGDRLLITLRDDFDWIPWPGHWDFVGGEREPGETPRETLVREAREEVGLDLAGADWLWEARFPSFANPARGSWFFVLRLPAEAEGRIVFGDEGQGFDPTSVREGLGISGMRERASALGGWLEIESEPGKGTSVRVEIPL